MHFHFSEKRPFSWDHIFDLILASHHRPSPQHFWRVLVTFSKTPKIVKNPKSDNLAMEKYIRNMGDLPHKKQKKWKLHFFSLLGLKSVDLGVCTFSLHIKEKYVKILMLDFDIFCCSAEHRFQKKWKRKNKIRSELLFANKVIS